MFKKHAHLSKILIFFKGHIKTLFLALFFLIIMILAHLFTPLIFRYLIDEAIPAKDITLVLKVGLLYLFILLIANFFGFLKDIIVGYLGISIVNEIKLKMLEHILGLSVRFFDKNAPGSLISRIEFDSQKLFTLFSNVGLTLIASTLEILISVTIMFLVNVKLTLLILTFVPLMIIFTYIIFSKLRPMFKKSREYYSDISKFLGEHLKGISLLRNLNNLNWSLNKFYDLNKKNRLYNLSISKKEELLWTFIMLLPQFSIALLLYKNITWLKEETITLGTLLMFIQYIYSIMFPIITISEQLGEIQRALGATDKIMEIFNTEPEIKEDKNPIKKFDFNSEIKFENVSFHYNKNKPILKNISFTIKKGSTFAIIGKTGSGKTTIISLLNRFYDPTEGKITIDGIDIKKIKLDEWRKKLSLVLQDIYLFPASLKDNLKALKDDIPENKIINAINIIGIKDIIEEMPYGYDTPILIDGNNLSYGQRQLLSFTRALTFEPEILIMDEASSSVDPYTEAKIQKSMKTMLEDRTVIIVAHRLSTIEQADKIIVLENGEIIEEGSHLDLLNKKNLYYELYHTQKGNIKKV